METLGDRLTRLMKLARLKNPDVAQVTGADATTVSKWRSDVQVPSEAKLGAIVELLRTRGVNTSVHELRHDGAHERPEPALYGGSDLEFDELTAKQRARVWLESLLLELAQNGATADFLAWARRFLMSSTNYQLDAPMDDEAKLRHMQGLAAGVREVLKYRGGDRPAYKELAERHGRAVTRGTPASSTPEKRRRRG